METLETWVPLLFFVAAGFSLIAAVNYGVAELFDSISFNSWAGLTVLLARVTSLLGVAGLSARILDRGPKVGKLSRVVVVVAFVFTVGPLTSAVLQNLGAEPPLTAVLGLGTVILSLATYSLFGIAIFPHGCTHDAGRYYRLSRRNTTSFTALTRAKLSFAHQKSEISEDVDTRRHSGNRTPVHGPAEFPTRTFN